MQTDKTLTIASANLFNFIAPPNAYYDFDNIYDDKAWQEKCLWTKDQLKQLNADIVGMQEVFSIEAARELFEQLGYRYFATVDTPHVEQDYIYSQPVVALASRYPILHASAVTPPAEIAHSYHVELPTFNRQPIHALIDVDGIGQVAVYVCHLKSQRATESSEPDNAIPLVGKWLSSLQRGWESTMLRVSIEQQYQSQPMPTVVIGDMNQALTSDITGILTQSIESDGNQTQLQDSWQLYSQSYTEQQRPPTHYHFAKGNVLDYILLSQEFHPDSLYSLADVTAYQTLDHHLINPSYEQDRQASDHAFIAVTVRFVL